MMTQRMPVVFLPHGAGPWPFVDLGFVDRAECDALAAYLRGLRGAIGKRPSALLVVSAHWEAPVPTVSSASAPPMLYDYYGFPPAAYTIEWPAPGDPALAGRVLALLGDAGIKAASDHERGFDHGTFVPLKVAFPDAEVPTVQLSLALGEGGVLDPAQHVAIGAALAPLRDEGVLIVGSGLSFHNMRAFRGAPREETSEASSVFDAWLQETIADDPDSRRARLERWSDAPSARDCHPREEHLLPLMVVAGAAGTDRGRVAWHGTFLGAHVSAFHFG
jgi:aromatic ring-opening dioxygenase catalytic subunit (LigB family)